MVMIKIRKTYWLPSIRHQWKAMEKENKGLSPFQQYDFVYNLWKNYYPYMILRKIIPVFYQIFEREEMVMIVPLNKHIDGRYSIFGDVNGCEYCDCVYKDGTDVLRYVSALRRHLGTTLFFSMIRESSPLFATLSNSDHYRFLSEKKNVEIRFSPDYASYYSSLSKSVRQNLRTAYNRMRKDHHHIDFVFLNKNKLFHSVYGDGEAPQATELADYPYDEISDTEKTDWYNKFIDLYVERHRRQYEVRTSWVKKWYLKHLNFSTVSLKHLDSSSSACVLIDNKLAAFMSGFENLRGTSWVIPRLSINQDFAFFSPGMILINETIKYLMSQTTIRNLDLSQGTEMYKYAMGG